MNPLGTKINALRSARKLTLGNLATLTGISKSRIWEIENRGSRPSITTVKKLAKALETTVEYLIDETGSSTEFEAVDKAFFARYQAMSPTVKARLRRIAKILEDA